MNYDLIVTEPQGLSRFFSLGYLSSGEHGVHWSCGRCGQDTAIGQETCLQNVYDKLGPLFHSPSLPSSGVLTPFVS